MSGDIDDFRKLLAKVGNGQTLAIDEAERAFDIMTSGDATPAHPGPSRPQDLVDCLQQTIAVGEHDIVELASLLFVYISGLESF